MQKRRLAAIMFSDIVGYTALMGKDEKKAFDFLRKNRRIHSRLIRKYGGRLLKEVGDGILTSFSSNIEAVMCALSIQSASKDLGIPLRIGIHLGDVIFEKNDVLGDGVNIASRIQGVADTNGIVISDTVYKDIKNKEGLEIESLGAQTFKGVDSLIGIYNIACKDENLLDFQIDTGELVRPLGPGRIPIILGILIIALLGYVLYYFLPQKDNLPSELGESVMVLPTDNYTGSDTLEYFLDGIHAALTAEIGKISALKRVISDKTARIYKDTDKTIPEIGNEVGANIILAPSLSCFGEDTLCLLVRGFRAYPDEKQLWTHEYYVDRSQILNWYKQLTKEFSSIVNAPLTTQEEENLTAESRAVDNEAYDLYMKGMVYNDQMSEDALKRAGQYFNLANEKDPTWAAPYRGMASVLERQYQMGFIERSQAVPKLTEYIDKAFELEPNSSWLYNLKASKAIWSDYDWEQGEQDFLKSIELNPNHAGNHAFFAAFLNIFRRTHEALEHARKAQELDPLNPLILGLCAGAFIQAGECQAAFNLIEKAISIEPNHYFAYPRLLDASVCIGDFETAFKVMKEINFDLWEKHEVIEHFEKIFKERGWLAFQEELIRICEEVWYKNEYLNEMQMARMYVAVDKYDKAMDYFEKAYEKHLPGMPSISSIYVYNKMKNNQRYIYIMKKMDLPIE